MTPEEMAKILEAVGEVKTEVAVQGSRLKAIEGHMAASNGTLGACVEGLGEHSTRIAVVEHTQGNLTEGWTLMQQRCETHVDRTAKIEGRLGRLTILLPVFSLVGGGLVKVLDIIGVL